jgi:protein TonB
MPDKKKLNVFEKGDTTFVGDEMPKFFNVESGLLKYMQTVVNYPHYAREVGTQGTVWLHFIINKKGYVDNLKVLSGIKDGLTEEAVRAIISMEKWTVGKKNGVPQDVKFTYPIRFKLQ